MRATVAKDWANLARMHLDSPHVSTAEAPGGAKGKAQDRNRCSYCTKLHILSDTIGRLSRVLLTSSTMPSGVPSRLRRRTAAKPSSGTADAPSDAPARSWAAPASASGWRTPRRGPVCTPWSGCARNATGTRAADSAPCATTFPAGRWPPSPCCSWSAATGASRTACTVLWTCSSERTTVACAGAMPPPSWASSDGLP